MYLSSFAYSYRELDFTEDNYFEVKDLAIKCFCGHSIYISSLKWRGVRHIHCPVCRTGFCLEVLYSRGELELSIVSRRFKEKYENVRG